MKSTLIQGFIEGRHWEATHPGYLSPEEALEIARQAGVTRRPRGPFVTLEHRCVEPGGLIRIEDDYDVGLFKGEVIVRERFHRARRDIPPERTVYPAGVIPGLAVFAVVLLALYGLVVLLRGG